jgi:hypothetical protein
MHWDVTDKLSTTRLIQAMTATCRLQVRRLVVVANFSSLLQREKKWKEAEPQLEELFRHASGPGSAAIWIEPRSKLATGQSGLLHRLFTHIKGKWNSFFTPARPAESAPTNALEESDPTTPTAESAPDTLTEARKYIRATTVHCRDPLEPAHTFRVNVATLHFHLESVA